MNLGYEFSKSAAKPKRESTDAPNQEPMRGSAASVRRKPSADQKKVRRQMARQRKTAGVAQEFPACPSCGSTDATPFTDGTYQGYAKCDSCGAVLDLSGQEVAPAGTFPTSSTTATKENPMSRQREAAILQAMAKADLPEQRRLAQELDALRAEASMQVQSDRDLDLADTVIRDTLTPVRVHEHHTASTDWLTEVPTVVEGSYDHEMRTEATLWFNKVHEAVREDREEFAEQAQGMARRMAGRYGEAAPAAAQVFLDTASRLHNQASDQNGNAESTVTDYDTKEDQDPLFAEDWPGNEPEGVHPPLPGAGEAANSIPTPTAARKTAKTCPECDGSGYETQDPDDENGRLCPVCGGSGDVDNPEDSPYRQSSRKTAVSLTNVGIAGENGVGTDPNGNRVKFRLSDKDRESLKSILLSDLAINFSGVTVDESDIIKDASKTAAEGQTCQVCGDKIAKDPSGEEPSTWHHDNGEKHDHEAKPGGGDSKESAKTAGRRCDACDGSGVFGDSTCYVCKGSGTVDKSAAKTAYSAPDSTQETCGTCGKQIVSMDYGWYHLAKDFPGGEDHNAHPSPHKASKTAGEVPESFKQNWNKSDDSEGDDSDDDSGKPWEKDSSLRTTAARPIYEIASDIRREWGSNVNYAAKPYLDAMLQLSDMSSRFYEDDAKTILAYFLSNSGSFRGERAKELKNEVKELLGRKTSAGGRKGNDFSLSDAKNEDGEWVMSPEQIRAEMAYDDEPDPDDFYDRYSSKQSSSANPDGPDDDDQDGNAESSLPDVEVGSEGDRPMWPWELGAEVQTGQGAAQGGTPTPSAESGYPQPKKSSREVPVPAQGRVADFRARVQAGLARAEEAPGSRHPFAREASGGWVDVARRIVENNAYEEVDGVILDLFSASAMLQVHDALGPENQAKFAAMPLAQAHDMAFKLIDRQSR